MMVCVNIAPVPGIYEIVNAVNGKRYIGSSNNIQSRIKTHIRYLEKGCHHSWKLQEDYSEARDKTIFSANIIEISESNNLKHLEQLYIDKYRTFDNGYNCSRYVIKPINQKRVLTSKTRVFQSKNIGAKNKISVNNNYITNDKLDNLSGNELLILLILIKANRNISRKEIEQSITCESGISAMTEKTMIKSINSLLDKGLAQEFGRHSELEHTVLSYRFKKVRPYANEFTDIPLKAVDALLNRMITPSQFRTYVVLNRNVQIGKSVTAIDLAKELRTGRGNISKHIRLLRENALVSINSECLYGERKYNVYSFAV